MWWWRRDTLAQWEQQQRIRRRKRIESLACETLAAFRDQFETSFCLDRTRAPRVTRLFIAIISSSTHAHLLIHSPSVWTELCDCFRCVGEFASVICSISIIYDYCDYLGVFGASTTSFHFSPSSFTTEKVRLLFSWSNNRQWHREFPHTVRCSYEIFQTDYTRRIFKIIIYYSVSERRGVGRSWEQKK